LGSCSGIERNLLPEISNMRISHPNIRRGGFVKSTSKGNSEILSGIRVSGGKHDA
jgi:hypothetical protein